VTITTGSRVAFAVLATAVCAIAAPGPAETQLIASRSNSAEGQRPSLLATVLGVTYYTSSEAEGLANAYLDPHLKRPT
jgi:hypothetical protein